MLNHLAYLYLTESHIFALARRSLIGYQPGQGVISTLSETNYDREMDWRALFDWLVRSRVLLQLARSLTIVKRAGQ